MKYNREDRVKILEYKFVFEEDVQVEKEFQEGNADLNYRLSFFREKLDHDLKQKDRYDTIFMGKVPENKTDLDLINQEELVKSSNRGNVHLKPWAKKLYKQIVMITHPDKTSEIQSQHLKEQLTEQYRLTQKAYDNEFYSDMIMVGFDLNISVPQGVIDEEIVPGIKKKKKKVKETKALIAWQWYHVPVDQRDAELKKILKQYGFKFTDNEVKDVVRRKYVKRKIGTRPEKINVKKRKLK